MDNVTDFERALDDCLDRMGGGEAIGACLTTYPEHAEALTPLLQVARELQQWDGPSLSASGYGAARQRAGEAFQTCAARKHHRRWIAWPNTRTTMRFAVSLAVALLVLQAIVQASLPSVPGELLYPVKRSSERVQLLITRQPLQRSILYLDYAERRVNEALTLAARGQILDPAVVETIDREYAHAWEALQALTDVDETVRAELAERYFGDVQALLRHVGAAETRAVDPAAVTSLAIIRDKLEQATLPPTICTTAFTVFSVDRGRQSRSGTIIQFQGNEIAGDFIEGFLADYMLNGIQDVVIDRGPMTAEVQGTLTATGPEGTLTLEYSGTTNQGIVISRQVDGTFVVVGGTGQFAGLQWRGRLSAHLDTINPPSFTVTATGPCSSRP